MKYKALKYNQNAKSNPKPKDAPVLKARSYNDIRFLTVFFEGVWLKKGPKRVVKILTQANETLWPVLAILAYNRDLREFTWTEPYNKGKTWIIRHDGTLGREI